MGCSASDMDVTSKQSRVIDKELAEDRKKVRRAVNLLILGAGESGKTTLCKQFQMINGYFSDEDRQKYGQTIKNSLIEFTKILVHAAEALNVPINNQDLVLKFLEQEGPLTQEKAGIIAELWKDEGIQKVFAARNKLFTLPDTCESLFAKVKEISAADYVPTDDDCLRVRLRTIGIVEYPLLIQDVLFKVIDVGGQRCARRKWIHCFDNVNCLMYCIALDDYSMVLAEDLKTNRLLESVKLFSDVMSIREIAAVPLIVFFNKSDMLEQKLHMYPLSDLFSTYKGGDDFEKAAKFIQSQYIQQIPPDRKHYEHITCALDKKNILFIWHSVRDMFLCKSLEDGGL